MAESPRAHGLPLVAGRTRIAALPRRLAVVLPVLLLSGSIASRADRVLLANGRVLDDVVAVASEDGVEIRLGGGTMTLSHSQVRAVESTAASLTGYRARAHALATNGATTAADWLELARWARARSFDFGVREAALTAAELAPGLPGLGGVMRELGYELDPASGRWLPLADALRARGWVEDEGEWMPAELAARRAEERGRRAEERRREAEAARLEQLTALMEAQALAGAAQASAPGYGGWPVWGYGGYGGSVGYPGWRPDNGPQRPHERPPRPSPPIAQPAPPPAGHTTSRPPGR